ncbi:MAG: TlpA family protein disulfide reductase [Chloroflexi bacterium]|nr:TlpA family protein disulfide reductase [Chloroflexota bacterium]
MSGLMPLFGESLFSRVAGRNKTALLGLIAVSAFALAACSGGSSADGTQASPTGSVSAPVEKPSEDAAPDFDLVLFETPNHTKGEPFKMSEQTGHPVIINFWFPSCPPCVAEMPDLEQVFQNHRDEGLEIVGVQLVGLDGVQDGQDFVNEIGVTYALGPDEDADIIMDYSVIGFPTSVFVNADGTIQRKWTGILNLEKMEELVSEIIN